jgi:hypothetical protein
MAVELRKLLLGGPGLDGYVYMGEAYCPRCGQNIVRDLHAKGELPATLDECADSERCPCPIFFGDTDRAVHCGNCGEYMYGTGPEDDGPEEDESEDESEDGSDIDYDDPSTGPDFPPEHGGES